MEERLRGAEFADSVERQIAGAVQGVGEWWQDATADQEGWGDDALRLLAGGAKNVAQGWQSATADQEGVFDDLLRLTEGGVKNTFRVLDAGSFYGGEVGGQFAKMLGWDPRIGGAIGNVAGDLALGFGVNRFRKAGQAATALGRISPLKAGNIMYAGPGASGMRLSQGWIHDFGAAIKKGDKALDAIIEADSYLTPTFKGERRVFNLTRAKDQGKLRKTLVSEILQDPDLAQGLYDGSIPRSALGEIIDQKGNRRRIQGFSKLFSAETLEQALDPKTLTFTDAARDNAANLERALRMKPPTDGSVEKIFRELWPDDPAMAAKMEKAWRKQQMVGFNRVQEAARQAGLSPKQLSEEIATGKVTPNVQKFLEQYDAGHWRATMSEPHFLMDDGPAWSRTGEFAGETKIWHAPTGDRTARIELRTANQLAKSDITHDINPFAAKKIGVPRTWEEDILMWVDRTMNTGKYPDWYELGTKYMAWAEDIPWDMPQKQVDELFEIFEAQVRADPQHWSNQRMKEILEDLAEAKEQAAKRAADIKANWDELEGPMTKAEAAAYDAELLQKR